MSKFNEHQFQGIVNANNFNEDDYLLSFAECDNCGEDVHVDDATVASPTDKERKSGFHVTNIYCGEDCARAHQSGPRKGRIGNPLGQIKQIIENDKGDDSL